MRSLSFGITLLSLTVGLQAGSVRLFNNSNFDLRAVIRGSDGSLLGEVLVHAQNTSTWTDSYAYAGGYQGPPQGQNQSGYRSKTPYVVLWYCKDGSDYSVCDTVSTGAIVMALGCPGPRLCKQPPPKKRGAATTPSGEQLQPEETTP